MEWFGWVNHIHVQKFVLPISVDKDNEYFPVLKNRLNDVINELSQCGAAKDIISAAEKTKDAIVRAIEQYYSGNILDAQNTVNNIIAEFGNLSPAVTTVNNGPSFPYINPDKKSQFFRARLSDSIGAYAKEEMLHVPFSKRELVASTRFSIPGLPCLYLGNTSYVCWMELGCPPDYRFNVSPVELDDSLRVFNLTVSFRNLYEMIDNMKDAYEAGRMDNADVQQYIISLIRLYMLALSTSFRVSQHGRNFKSEYIIPQMIMLACKDQGLDGVSYYSKRIDNDSITGAVSVNIALFALYDGVAEYSPVCQKVDIDESLNFAMFKNLGHSQRYRNYRLAVLNSPFAIGIKMGGRSFPYSETEFSELDQYLFINWDEKRQRQKRQIINSQE